MMGWSGWGAAGSLAMMVGMLLLVVLAVAGLVLLFRPVFRSDDQREQKQGAIDQTADMGGPLGSIEERYARGEMDRAEFLERRGDLLGRSR